MKIAKIVLSVIFFSLIVCSAYAVECGPTKVKSIDPNKDGGVWLKFTNGTQFCMKPEIHPGLNNTLSVALTAFAMDADVKIDLGDMSQCGKGGNATSWIYLKLAR